MNYAKHPSRHVWFADFHNPGPRTVLRCRKCGVLLDEYRDRQHQERKTRMEGGRTFCACGNPWPCPRRWWEKAA